MDGKSYFDGEGLRITDAEFEKVKISNLSHRPNSVTAYGGKALSAQELKEKYDAPTKMLKDKFNALIDEIVKIEGPNSAEQARRANEDSRQDAEEKRQEFYGDLIECLDLLEELQEKMLESVKETGSAMTSVLDAYPIGSVYISLSQTSPAILFGGAWEPIKNRFLFSTGEYAAGIMGGSVSHIHDAGALIAAISINTNTTNAILEDAFLTMAEVESPDVNIVTRNTQVKAESGITVTRKAGASTSKYGTRVVGTTNDADNMPPYLVVYMWKRIE